MATWTDTVSGIRAVLFEEAAGIWSAQCLEYDIAAQAGSLFDLQDEIVRVLVTHVAACAQLGREPFSGVKPAPARFWSLWETGLRVDCKTASFSCASVSMPPITPSLRIARAPTPPG
jgi:hypothetical protein